MTGDVVRVLVAEDSLTAQELLVGILESDPGIRVVGTAKNGLEAVEKTRELKPDLVTMDVHMPRMDGLEATKEIMIRTPTPIVIVTSSASIEDVERSLDATQIGALMVLEKPTGPSLPGFETQRAELIRMVKAMARVKVVSRLPGRRDTEERAAAAPNGPFRIVGLAASTGGPGALRRALADMPRNLAAPVLVVQHIAQGFTEGFTEWLGTSSPLRVELAADGQTMRRHTVYVAPESFHLEVRNGRIRLVDEPPAGGHRPSADRLFASLAREYGAGALVAVLTGMGRDGAEGARQVKEAGGRVLAQDEASSVVFGMPRAAVEDARADEVLPISEVGARIAELVGSDDD